MRSVNVPLGTFTLHLHLHLHLVPFGTFGVYARSFEL